MHVGNQSGTGDWMSEWQRQGAGHDCQLIRGNVSHAALCRGVRSHSHCVVLLLFPSLGVFAHVLLPVPCVCLPAITTPRQCQFQ
eukprot:6297324-Pyramimonas_sp.AAC.1